jgi:hypothetical protein
MSMNKEFAMKGIRGTLTAFMGEGARMGAICYSVEMDGGEEINGMRMVARREMNDEPISTKISIPAAFESLRT